MATSTRKRAFVTMIDKEDAEVSTNSEESDGDTDHDENDDEGCQKGNSAWADAMAKVLASKPPKNKRTVLLSRAKKDSSVQMKQQKAADGVEVVNEKGQNLQGPPTTVSEKQPLDGREWQERKKQKSQWETMGRQKPDVLHKERERHLTVIATKGVVQLFNAVQQHQKRVDRKLSMVKNSEVKHDKVMRSVKKGEFLDLLKGVSSEKVQAPITHHRNENEKWNVLRDDFLMGATLKDWDKNAESEEDV